MDLEISPVNTPPGVSMGILVLADLRSVCRCRTRSVPPLGWLAGLGWLAALSSTLLTEGLPRGQAWPAGPEEGGGGSKIGTGIWFTSTQAAPPLELDGTPPYFRPGVPMGIVLFAGSRSL